MKYRKCTSNERVWCTTKLAKLSFNHSISIHSWRFSIFNKNRPAVIGFVLLWSTTTVPNITFQLSKTKVKKWFPCRVYYSLGFSQEPNTLLVPGIRVMSSAESRKYYKHSAQNHISYGITYLVRYSSSCIPAGTAVHNQQDRRRASDGGRATEGEICMYTANTAAALPAVIDYIHILRTAWCVSVLVLLCTTNTSGGGRAKVGERRRASDIYVCTQQYSSICSSIYIFSVYPYAVYDQHERGRASEGGRATEGERYVCTQQYSSTRSSIFIFSVYRLDIYTYI